MTTTANVLYKGGDKPFYCTPAQAEVLDRMSAINKGGIGSVIGYKPTTGYVAGKGPTVNLQIITRFETGRLYARKRDALDGITFAECAEDIAKHPKLSALPAAECLRIFNERKQKVMDSLQQTLDGDRDDNHRQGHDRCYARVADGLKVNYVTEKDKATGLKMPVLTDGHPTAESILLSYLELHKTIVVEGEYKVVNSGPDVLMGNIIESKLNKRSVGFKTLSLKEDNFTSLNVAKQTFTPDDLKAGSDPGLPQSKLMALMEACGFNI